MFRICRKTLFQFMKSIPGIMLALIILMIFMLNKQRIYIEEYATEKETERPRALVSQGSREGALELMPKVRGVNISVNQYPEEKKTQPSDISVKEIGQDPQDINKVSRIDKVAPDDTNTNLQKHSVTLASLGSPDGIGEFGKPVVINKFNLTAKEKEVYDAGYQYAGYNVLLSNRISLRRRVPDLRPKECSNIKYPDVMPKASVVIPFYKEALTVLLRTIHSVIDRSPDHLLEEVVLIDDFSQMEFLGQPLEDYIALWPKVKLIRNTKREGLIRARMIGITAAKGPVIVVKDAHTEYTEGWLEPLVYAIAKNRSTVAMTHINGIDPNDFRIFGSDLHGNLHIFDFMLYQALFRLSNDEIAARQTDTEPMISPTMSGSEFAVDKSYFMELGGYDPGMEIWGGDDYELAFKAWMCGGSVQLIPCSQVAHIYRNAMHRTYKTQIKNYFRLAEVWMDEYKELVYERYGTFKTDIDMGDVSERVALRKRLNCRSFDWFMKNVASMIYVPHDVISRGEVANPASSSCLTAGYLDWHNPSTSRIYARGCSKRAGDEFWMLTQLGEVRRDEGCLTFDKDKSRLYLPRCTGEKGSQEWHHNINSTLVHVESGMCLEITETTDGVTMTTCHDGNTRQMWRFG